VDERKGKIETEEDKGERDGEKNSVPLPRVLGNLQVGLCAVE